MPHEFGRYTDEDFRKKGDWRHEETRREAAEAEEARELISKIQEEAAEEDRRDSY